MWLMVLFFHWKQGVVRKKGKTAGVKPPKKVRKKAQVQKRTKTKK